jgi:secreted Zn-dependent insulinase-like peptidase
VTLPQGCQTFDWISPVDVALVDGPAPQCSGEAEFGALANRREPWYGVHFYQRAINHSEAKRFATLQSLSLPLPNRFVPRELLDPSFSARVPSRDISSDPFYFNPPANLNPGDLQSCWWSEDLLFSQPRTAIHLLIGADLSLTETYLESQMNAVLERLFSQVTASKRYSPSIAGLHQGISWTHR